RLSLLGEGPAAEDKTLRPPVRQPLFRGEGDSGFSTFLGATLLTTELMEHSRTIQSITQAHGVRTLLCQGHCLGAPRQPLMRIAQTPQCPSAQAATKFPGVFSVEECRGTVLLGIIELYPLSKVHVRCGCSPEDE